MANWPETVYGTHPDSGAHPAPESVSEKQPPCATPLPEIPPMFKRDKEAEATAKKADVYVRFMAKP